MDLANVGRLHQFQVQQLQDDSEAKAIRGAMIQKREALECIEREIAQLVENKRGMEEDLVHLSIALAPHNHNTLPNEVLSHIFILLALDYGTVKFPIPKYDTAPQLVVSHVCSHWQTVALCTPELWSNTHISLRPETRNQLPDHVIRLHRWLFRARTFLITLSIMFDSRMFYYNGLESAWENILLPIQAKRLLLDLTFNQFMKLLTSFNSEAVFSNLSEFKLHLTFTDDNVDANINGQHPLITRLRSLTFFFENPVPETYIEPLRPSLPWSQLRNLDFGAYVDDFRFIFGILQQTQMLEVLSLSIFSYPDSDSEQLTILTMPSLRNFTMEIESVSVDKILSRFMCPSLTKFSLITPGEWTRKTFEILKRQYNMQELQGADIVCNIVCPFSSFLQEAPMLRSLSLEGGAIMDDEAVRGISNGTLGKFLKRLELRITCDVGEMLDIVEARKKTVDRLMKNGCSWREEITTLEDVEVPFEFRSNLEEQYSERVMALEEAGITIRAACFKTLI
ncbi:hypothetical protein AX14_005247 [Amanita brunnescens Koide BX004]|nr:hypothetical protein AX14_005247 [Amanita brunnescens Koide BX004]